MVSPSPGQPGSRSGVEVRFGPFEISSESCELRKLGIRIRLQPMPFRILTALVENPGAVVTRDDLRRRLWPEDTFVDFERGLNTAVNRLRLALGDSAEHLATLKRWRELATASSRLLCRYILCRKRRLRRKPHRSQGIPGCGICCS